MCGVCTRGLDSGLGCGDTRARGRIALGNKAGGGGGDSEGLANLETPPSNGGAPGACLSEGEQQLKWPWAVPCLPASSFRQPRSLLCASLGQGQATTPDHTSHDYLLSSPTGVCSSAELHPPAPTRALHPKGSLNADPPKKPLDFATINSRF